MYLPPLVGLVWDWSFCCEYKYLVTWQYKQALAGRAVLTTRKGVGTSVTIRNSSMFVEMIGSLVPARPKRCDQGGQDGRQPEVVALLFQNRTYCRKQHATMLLPKMARCNQ